MKSMSRAGLMAALMCCASIAGVALRPSLKEEPNFLEATVPETFGEWKRLEERVQIIDPATD